jgi:hypothetical protein
MESMESHEARLPTLPTLFGNPFGIPTFPRPRRLEIYVFSCPLNWKPCYCKGLVTDVSGPQRNACPGTLTGSNREAPVSPDFGNLPAEWTSNSELTQIPRFGGC